MDEQEVKVEGAEETMDTTEATEEEATAEETTEAAAE